MKKQAAVAAVLIGVAALATVAIRMPGTGSQTGKAASPTSDVAYDYEARDVVVQQMGPDGVLQYQLEAKRIAQLPENGQLSAEQMVIHHDPAGTTPGGEHRWTLSANQATLPEDGDVLILQGQVRANGRPQGSSSTVALATEQLSYNLETQDVATSQPVDITWGPSRFRGGNLRMNIKQGTVEVRSPLNGTYTP